MTTLRLLVPLLLFAPIAALAAQSRVDSAPPVPTRPATSLPVRTDLLRDGTPGRTLDAHLRTHPRRKGEAVPRVAGFGRVDARGGATAGSTPVTAPRARIATPLPTVAPPVKAAVKPTAAPGERRP